MSSLRAGFFTLKSKDGSGSAEITSYLQGEMLKKLKGQVNAFKDEVTHKRALPTALNENTTTSESEKTEEKSPKISLKK